MTILVPLAVFALALSYRRHRQALPLGLGVLALGIAYLHVFAGTPEWTMALVMALSIFAAAADWWAAKSMPPRWSPRLLNYVRQLLGKRCEAMDP